MNTNMIVQCAPIADDSADQGVSEYNCACAQCRNQLTLSLRAGNVRYDTQDRGVEEGKGMGRGILLWSGWGVRGWEPLCEIGKLPERGDSAQDMRNCIRLIVSKSAN